MPPLDLSAAAAKSAAVASKSAASGSGVDRSMTGPPAVAALAHALGVSHHTAQRALEQITEPSGQGGVDPAGAAFAAVARELGVSPDRLATALGAVKQAVAGR